MAKTLDFITYCGHYCATCPSYTHELADIAKELRDKLRKCKFAKVAPILAKLPKYKTFRHYDKCYQVLGAMMKIRCDQPCRLGGGGATCPIKKCAKKRKLDGCWQCDEDFATCKTLKVLEDFNAGDRSHITNLRKLKRYGPAAFVREKKR